MQLKRAHFLLWVSEFIFKIRPLLCMSKLVHVFRCCKKKVNLLRFEMTWFIRLKVLMSSDLLLAFTLLNSFVAFYLEEALSLCVQVTCMHHLCLEIVLMLAPRMFSLNNNAAIKKTIEQTNENSSQTSWKHRKQHRK